VWANFDAVCLSLRAHKQRCMTSPTCQSLIDACICREGGREEEVEYRFRSRTQGTLRILCMLLSLIAHTHTLTHTHTYTHTLTHTHTHRDTHNTNTHNQLWHYLTHVLLRRC